MAGGGPKTRGKHSQRARRSARKVGRTEQRQGSAEATDIGEHPDQAQTQEHGHEDVGHGPAHAVDQKDIDVSSAVDVGEEHDALRTSVLDKEISGSGDHHDTSTADESSNLDSTPPSSPEKNEAAKTAADTSNALLTSLSSVSDVVQPTTPTPAKVCRPVLATGAAGAASTSSTTPTSDKNLTARTRTTCQQKDKQPGGVPGTPRPPTTTRGRASRSHAGLLSGFVAAKNEKMLNKQRKSDGISQTTTLLPFHSTLAYPGSFPDKANLDIRTRETYKNNLSSTASVSPAPVPGGTATTAAPASAPGSLSAGATSAKVATAVVETSGGGGGVVRTLCSWVRGLLDRLPEEQEDEVGRRNRKNITRGRDLPDPPHQQGQGEVDPESLLHTLSILQNRGSAAQLGGDVPVAGRSDFRGDVRNDLYDDYASGDSEFLFDDEMMYGGDHDLYPPYDYGDDDFHFDFDEAGPRGFGLDDAERGDLDDGSDFGAWAPRNEAEEQAALDNLLRMIEEKDKQRRGAGPVVDLDEEVYGAGGPLFRGRGGAPKLQPARAEACGGGKGKGKDAFYALQGAGSDDEQDSDDNFSDDEEQQRYFDDYMMKMESMGQMNVMGRPAGGKNSMFLEDEENDESDDLYKNFYPNDDDMLDDFDFGSDLDEEPLDMVNLRLKAKTRLRERVLQYEVMSAGFLPLLLLLEAEACMAQYLFEDALLNVLAVQHCVNSFAKGSIVNEEKLVARGRAIQMICAYQLGDRMQAVALSEEPIDVSVLGPSLRERFCGTKEVLHFMPKFMAMCDQMAANQKKSASGSHGGSRGKLPQGKKIRTKTAPSSTRGSFRSGGGSGRFGTGSSMKKRSLAPLGGVFGNKKKDETTSTSTQRTLAPRAQGDTTSSLHDEKPQMKSSNASDVGSTAAKKSSNTSSKNRGGGVEESKSFLKLNPTTASKASVGGGKAVLASSGGTKAAISTVAATRKKKTRRS